MDLDYGAICVTIPMVDLREYLDLHGPQAAAKIATALTRLSLGNMSNVKAPVLVCSNCGSISAPVPSLFRQGWQSSHHRARRGIKQRQQRDINTAIANWKDYKQRK